MTAAPSLFDVEPAPIESEHQDHEPEPTGRRYRCARCAGIVSVPRGAGPITTERVRAVHDASCPSPPARKPKTGEQTP